jgi:hypothetical protein
MSRKKNMNCDKPSCFVRTDSEVFTSSEELTELLNRPHSALGVSTKSKVSVWLNRLRSAKAKAKTKNKSNIWLNRLRSANAKAKSG